MTTLIPIALSLLLQSTALLLLGLLALRLAQKCGPTVQTLIGRSTLTGVALLLLLAPLTGHVHPLWRVTLEPVSARPSAAKPTPPRSYAFGITSYLPPLTKREGQASRTSPGPSFRVEEDKTASQQGAAIDQGAASSAPTPATPPLRPPLWGGPLRSKEVGSYAAITLTLLLWLTVCQGHLTRLRRTATPLTSGPAADLLAKLTPRPPQLLTHPTVRSPFLAGLAHPAIFLPPTYAADFDPDALRAILAHELAHLQRRDNLWTLAARLLFALLWPQPLLWLLCRQMEQIAEDACDAAVLAQNCPPRAYADCLLTLAERHPLPRRQRALGAGVAPYRSSLGRRVQRILTQGNQTMPPISTKLRFLIAALTLAAVLGGICTVSSAPAQVSHPVPTHADNPAIVGIWIQKSSPTSEIVVLGPQGDAAVIDNGGLRCQYYRYTINGSALTVTHTRTEDHGRVVSDSGGPQTFTGTYNIANGILTVHNQHSTDLAQRVSAYPEGIPLETVVAQQASLSISTLHWQQSSELNQARFLAGLTAVQGPGVIVTLQDSKRPYPHTLPPGMSSPNIIHDSDINQVVTELKAGGAEAISVNDQRLVATSAVRCVGPLVYVNNNPQTPPYTIKVIGNSTAMLAVLKCPGGIASQVQNFDPAMFSVRESKTLDLPAFKGDDTPHYAKPFEANAPILTLQEQHYLAAKTQDLQNLRQLGLAVTQYASDNEGRYPDADHWMDQVYPYFKNKTVFYDPFQPGQRYGYAFNRNCSKKSMRAFVSPSNTVIVYASTLGTRNASDTGASLRINQPPSNRLPTGSGYVFVDIHTKWFRQGIHPSFSLMGETPSREGNDVSILGTWLGPDTDGTRAALIFSPGNIVEEIGPWSGDSRKIAHSYGRYNARPTTLKYIFTRVWVEGTPIYTVTPEKHIIDYTLSQSGNVLTIGLNGKYTNVYHRNDAYTVHKPKGFLWI